MINSNNFVIFKVGSQDEAANFVNLCPTTMANEDVNVIFS